MLKKKKPYSKVSDIYPHLMRFINYNDWAHYYYSITKNNLKSKPKVLELAAGNGSLAVNLKKYYKNIIVSDYSLNMLQKCKDDGLLKVCCNMVNLPFKKKYDLIFSAFDSFNYLLTKKALSNLFREINELLDDSGIFSFDVTLELNSINHISYLNRKGIFNGVSYIQKSVYNKGKKIHTNKFTLTYPDGSKVEEVHQQRIYPMELYFKLLTENGFYIQNCFDAFTFNDASSKSYRIQFVALKNKSYANV
ncbi:MAG: methyltransferase domain-containing protein [Ignavibacteriales bacterium]|nr:methyltransferase domain-containing protein [Ignavibacteriales bacterium]